MENPDTAPVRADDIWTALGLLTRLPLPARDWNAARPAAMAAWAYPLVGAVVGGLAALVGACALWLGLPPGVAAALILATGSLLTGAMHEDGLADTCDGIWGGATPARRLEIMKDSHIGTYGVLALIISVILRWSALATLLAAGHVWAALVVAAVISRASMVGVMYALPHARETGLAHMTGQAGRPALSIAALLGALCALVAFGPVGLVLLLIAALVALASGAVAMAKIGGQTGDILGATQQLCEMVLLAALCTLLL